jgi:DNA gyrase subunit A
MAMNVEFSEQINLDQKRYSRYVCDSRAIPNEIDGLKPVQRRILWTMWNSVAKNAYTKTVKVAGLVMGYHPHGDASIQDAISAMVQDFVFANNHPLIAGEGTFGDVLDPAAIASPRYTEVKLSDFSKDAGYFESLPDIEYADNYDETTKEPIFYVPKVPTVLLNSITGIATGFRTSIPAHRLAHVVEAMTLHLKGKKIPDLIPWYKGFGGKTRFWKGETGQTFYTTGFGFSNEGDKVFLTHAPQNWNREKVVEYLEEQLEKEDCEIRSWLDHSKETFRIELAPRRGARLTPEALEKVFSKENNEAVVMNVINSDGRLAEYGPAQIIKRFCEYRKAHLVRRFKRLAELEKEKIERQSELIRFLDEKWNLKVTTIKNKADLEGRLKDGKFKYWEWLAELPVYRMTREEVAKCREAIAEAKAELSRYNELIRNEKKLVDFMIAEIAELRQKWDPS